MTLATNRKARHNYQIEETFEAGIVLTGSEVKVLRDKGGQIAEAYVSHEQDELWLVNAHIDPYEQASYNQHTPRRKRKLLMNRREINKLGGKVEQAGYALLPLKLYVADNGKIKLQVGLGKGIKKYDKREQEKRKEWRKEKQNLLNDR